jgi:glutamate-5-semialdehyde dehydrogenase
MSMIDAALPLAARARAASRALQTASTATKNAVLERIASSLTSSTTAAQVLAANGLDVEAARAAGLDPALVDRLVLDAPRLAALQRAVRDIVAQDDPVGQIESLTKRPSGIVVGRMQVPLGVVLIVYESRPNVTVDAAVLCLKAGNAVILRGGKEALHTNRALAALVGDALVHEGLPRDAALFVDDTDRALLYALLRCTADIDLAIPRGGRTLIDAVNEHARVPVIQHYQGICHVYVHQDADLAMAEGIVVNGKVSRPGVCNATECMLVDERIAATFLPRLVKALLATGVELVGCERTMALVGVGEVAQATAADFDTEFLRLKLAIKIVDDEADAVDFIARHGSRHTEAIVTNNHEVAMRFLHTVDASCVLINASTRFNDGGELGLGAELGISTSKLHAYGPMGLQELCTRKFVVLGHGEVR